jgi:hypothetical protein
MALFYDPIAREQLNEMRISLGPRYNDGIWTQRAFEQETRNAEALSQWRQSFPAWDRLFGRPAKSMQAPSADIIAMPGGRAQQKSKAA